jgi:hypothetical protein
MTGGSDPGFIVTLRSVYDEVMRISAQLQAHMAKQDTSVALIEQRLAQVEGEIRQLYAAAQTVHDRNEEERRHRNNNRWLVIASLVGAVAAVVLTIFFRSQGGH